MAHKKAGGSKARQSSNQRGKRLGVKIFWIPTSKSRSDYYAPGWH